MIKHLLAVTVLVTSAMFSFASAAPYSVDDFAQSSMISDAKTSLRQIQIPKNLYQKMQRRDYGDLRVFSADGQVVPHQFSHSSTRLDSKQEVPLVFYPFNKEQAKNPSNIRVIINQKAGEQSLSINQNLAKNISNDSKINEYQYIIVNKPDKKQASSLCKLQLDWQQSKPSSILSFKLESSNKLQNWRTLNRKVTVSKLDYAGSQLKQDTVNFSCTTQKYLRLTWLKPEQQTHLSQIKGIYTKKGAQQIQWESFGKPRYSKKDGSWLFESNVIASISKLEFVAPQDGLLYQGALYSRGNGKQTWRYRTAISQYRLNLGDTTLQSSPVSFSQTSDRYWKLALKTEGQLSESQLPEIRAGWIPKQLYFLAQGTAPFTLAFGNPNIKLAQNNNLSGLIDSIKQSGANIDSVSLGEFVTNKNVKEAKSETPWKLILFWLFLILGTALMGFMAYRLFQQMSEDK
jgi:hypothetical protein